MKFEPTTLKDIAKTLGLSVSTVSRALRDSYEISPETKKLVLEYASKINYYPNPIAQSLKERRSHSIGVVVCEIANNFFSQVINGVESIAYNSGYHVIISQSNESYEREVVNVQHLASRSVDGLLISLSADTTDISHLKALHDKGLPIVFFDRTADEINTHKVIANNFKGAFDATDHLIRNGFSTIAHITGSAHLSITKERLKGYLAALEKHNIPFKKEYVFYCDYKANVSLEVEKAVKQLLLQYKPDAVFVAYDTLSTGGLQAIKKYTPENKEYMAVAGFSNSNVVDLFAPSMVSVRQQAFEMGQVATELLIQLIESKQQIAEFETRILDTELISADKIPQIH